MGGRPVFGVEDGGDGIDVRGVADELEALQSHGPVATVEFHGHGHHGSCAMRGLSEELGVDGLEFGIVGGHVAERDRAIGLLVVAFHGERALHGVGVLAIDESVFFGVGVTDGLGCFLYAFAGFV